MEPTSTQKIYEEHHKDRRAVGFSILEKERGELFRAIIGEHKAVLDVGCRDGALTKYFSNGNLVVGVDIDANALMKAANTLGIETIFVDLNGDWHEIRGRKFDYVVAGEVIEHLYYPDKVLGNICAHMVAGGTLLGSVPNAFSFKNRIRLLFGRKKNTPLEDPTHINHFSYQELFQVMSRYFEHVEIRGLGRAGAFARMFPSWFAFDLVFVCRIPKGIR